MKVGFVGAGKVGRALGLYFGRYGVGLSGYCSRTYRSAADAAGLTRSRAFDGMEDLIDASGMIFLTVPDGALAEVDAQAAALMREKENPADRCWIHTSGALSSDCLEKLKASGCPVGSMHPLQSFGTPEKSAQSLDRALFSVEGTNEAVEALRLLLGKTNGQFSLISAARKPLYHAGACIVSNYLVTLLESGIRCFEAAGIGRKDVFRAIGPLIDSTLCNVQEKGAVEALTGPIVRGDSNTLNVHLRSIGESLPSELGFYREMAAKTIEMIAGKRITKEQEDQLRKLLEGV